MQSHSLLLLLGTTFFVNNPVIAVQTYFNDNRHTSSHHPSRCPCLPDQFCWPSLSTWSAFNVTIGGNLLATTPVARECHDPDYDETECDTIKKIYGDDDWRRSQPGAVLISKWETFHGQGCLGFNKSMPCNQVVSIYTVKATSVADVQDAIRFAHKHNIRLTIKNTGHDFLGRSSAPSSIGVWVTSMRKIKFDDNFVPDRAPHGTEGRGAIILEPGVLWGKVYKAADDHNVVLVGGAHYSVGAVGGYCLGGGHSPLSPRHGLCVDNVLQYSVVSANGEVRIANNYQNQDLFWALRGGGPGFGVIVEAVYRTHPALKNLISAQAAIFSSDASSMAKIARDFYSRHDAWSEEGWSGYALIAGSAIVVQYVEQASASFSPFIDYARSFPTVAVVSNTVSDSTFYSLFLKQWGSMFGQSYAGNNGVLGSRLIPRSLFQSNLASI